MRISGLESDDASRLDIKIIFNHVPKAGGTSLIRFFQNLFGEDKCFRHRQRNPATDEYSPAIGSLTEEQLEKYYFFAGHFDYGNHTRFSGSSLYIGVVRDPVERLRSDYFFNRSAGRGDLRELANSLTLEEYALHKLDNPKSRMSRSSQITYLTAQDDLHKAKQILQEEYLIACTSDQLDRCQLLLADWYQRPDLRPQRINVSKRRTSDGLSRATARRIKKASSTDYKFIAYIENAFEEICWI